MSRVDAPGADNRVIRLPAPDVVTADRPIDGSGPSAQPPVGSGAGEVHVADDYRSSSIGHIRGRDLARLAAVPVLLAGRVADLVATRRCARVVTGLRRAVSDPHEIVEFARAV